MTDEKKSSETPKTNEISRGSQNTFWERKGNLTSDQGDQVKPPTADLGGSGGGKTTSDSSTSNTTSNNS